MIKTTNEIYGYTKTGYTEIFSYMTIQQRYDQTITKTLWYKNTRPQTDMSRKIQRDMTIKSEFEVKLERDPCRSLFLCRKVNHPLPRPLRYQYSQKRSIFAEQSIKTSINNQIYGSKRNNLDGRFRHLRRQRQVGYPLPSEWPAPATAYAACHGSDSLPCPLPHGIRLCTAGLLLPSGQEIFSARYIKKRSPSNAGLLFSF